MGGGHCPVWVENDGNANDGLKVVGLGSPPGYKLTYILYLLPNGSQPRTDVTAQVVAGTFSFANVAPGREGKLVVFVKVGKTVPVSSVLDIPVTATSQNDNSKSDTVKVKVTVT